MEETDEWDHAIERYINPSPPRKPDPAPLAVLLLSDKPIPKNVRWALAEIIRPTRKICRRPNYKIVLKPTGAFDRFLEKGLRHCGIAFAVAAEVRSGKSVEQASELVATQLSRQRPKIKLKPETVKDYFEESNKAWKMFGLEGVKRGKPKKNRDDFGGNFCP